MWALNHKVGRAPNNWCFQSVVLEKTLDSPCKEIQPAHPKGNQPWIFIGRTDAEVPILWRSDGKSLLTGKNTDSRKDWRQKEKGAAEDEMVGWHHRFQGHELGQACRDSEGQGGLACCSPRGCKQSDTTCWLNNKRNWFIMLCWSLLYRDRNQL